MKVQIDKFYAAAIWKYDFKEIQGDMCSICRNAFDLPCPSCKTPGDDCPPLEGKCDHTFHMHCVYQWLQKQQVQTCPNCRDQWEEKKESADPVQIPQPAAVNLAQLTGQRLQI